MASYEEAIAYLYGLQSTGIKFGLRTIRGLMEALDHPERRFASVHVGGTNGKGSTAAMIAAVLQRAGHRVGLYTSPHLVDFTERVRVNGHRVPPEEVAALTAQLRRICPPQVTFFEVTTALALWHFARQGVEVAVVEVGMGGRLDATNVVRPETCVITNVSLEHQQFLGHTVEDIAREKAGIVKAGVPVVSGVRGAALRVLGARCEELRSPLYLLGRDFRLEPGGRGLSWRGRRWRLEGLRLGLAGAHQRENAALALAALEVLEERGWRVGEEAVRQGLEEVRWPGRLEEVWERPRVVLDGAHNPAAMRALVRSLNGPPPRTAVMGVMADKDVKGMLREAAAAFQQVVLTRPRMERACSVERLARVAGGRFERIWCVPEVGEAVALALERTPPEGTICVTGSLFTVGEARCLFRNVD